MKQPGGSLSGGEQQMLAIARGLMMDPALIMLDEPSLGLAPIIVEEIFVLIAKIRGIGKTVLLIEQNASMTLSEELNCPRIHDSPFQSAPAPSCINNISILQ